MRDLILRGGIWKCAGMEYPQKMRNSRKEVNHVSLPVGKGTVKL